MFTVIIENKNYRTKSHISINAYNVWNRNWQIVDKQMIFELCYIEAIFPKHCVHKDTARYVLSYSKPLELLYQVNGDFFQSQIIKQYVYRFFLLIYTKV